MVRENGRKENRIALLRQKLSDANKDLNEVNEALHNLRTVTEDLEEDREPTLDDYYEPSDEMKRYMDLVTGAIGLRSGYLFTKIFVTLRGYNVFFFLDHVPCHQKTQGNRTS